MGCLPEEWASEGKPKAFLQVGLDGNAPVTAHSVFLYTAEETFVLNRVAPRGNIIAPSAACVALGLFCSPIRKSCSCLSKQKQIEKEKKK